MTSTARAIIYLSTVASLASAFTGVTKPEGGEGVFHPPSFFVPPPAVKRTRGGGRAAATAAPSRRPALIYGWDEDDVVEESNEVRIGGIDSGGGGCSPAGVAVAESLSYDRDRAGSLARLAVAFSPPERALSLDQIEAVDVICVREDAIDIQAVICEDGGCVSLAVPIKFPNTCDSNEEWMEGCVRRNVEELDEFARSTLLKKSQDDSGEQDLCVLDDQVDFPSWWVPPGCTEAMAAECSAMRNILNEAEFKTDIVALAQDSLNHAQQQGEGPYAVREAKVAAIGPAGLCFKVRAQLLSSQQPQDRPAMHVLDVMYPFGGGPLDSVESLRAAVLGLVATADAEPY